ncbi:MAG TPA: discoidin domain-containing protein [Solirubrobacteraceae bacterium]|nr:discoidin domain-containing protein [Solirubrobacteraceae bacterium]
MGPQLADSASVTAPSEPSAEPSAGAADGGAGAGRPPTEESAGARAAQRGCAKCGAPLAPGQDWCLMCGAGAPGSLGGPGWRSAASVLAVVLVLVLGAAAAAYAAFDKGSQAPRPATTTVAQVPPATTSVPSTPTVPATPTPTTPGAATTTPAPAPAKGSLGLGGTTTTPPKIPLTASTPKSAGGNPSGAQTGTSESGTSTSGATRGGSGAGAEASEEPTEEKPSAILLDTDAAETYDPYAYPAAWFGDPSLAIDGDTATAWTAQVNPATAPKLAEGLLIDLKAKQKVSALELVTSTPGMTVQVYGAAVNAAPSSIVDPAWIALTGPKVAKKKRLRLTLRDSHKAFTFVALWISKAPKSAIGTAEAPGHVDVNEIELFPTS